MYSLWPCLLADPNLQIRNLHTPKSCVPCCDRGVCKTQIICVCLIFYPPTNMARGLYVLCSYLPFNSCGSLSKHEEVEAVNWPPWHLRCYRQNTSCYQETL